MGFLSDLLNPVKHIKNAVHGVKSLASGDIKGALDPSGILGLSKPRAAVGAANTMTPAATTPSVTDPAQYMGDTGDDAYGSFNKPFDVEEFYKYQDPGYAFRLQQGNQAVQNRNSAGSGALSGSAYKDLIDYNQGAASTEYGAAFDRYNTSQGNIFNRLSQLAGLGQNAAANVGNNGTTLAGNAGQFTSNAGTAAGSGIVGAGNALAGGATNAWLWNQYGGSAPKQVPGPVYGNDF